MTEPLLLTRVTHSCHLIRCGGMTVLTDPCSPSAPYLAEPIARQPENAAAP
jgi:hypothetical protein